MNIKKLFTTNFYKNNNREYKERIKIYKFISKISSESR